MSDIGGILQNLDKRVGALESESLDDYEGITEISKMYVGIEIEVKFRHWLHRYRRCGDTQPLYPARCGTDMYL